MATRVEKLSCSGGSATRPIIRKLLVIAFPLLVLFVYFEFNHKGHFEGGGPGGGRHFLKPATKDAPEEDHMKEATATTSEWRCCINATSVNPLKHPSAYGVEDPDHHYVCPNNPSNLSYYYYDGSRPGDIKPVFELDKWKNRTVAIFGGSVSRQMQEQCKWEFSNAADCIYGDAYFLFRRTLVGGGTIKARYAGRDILDLRTLHPKLEKTLTSPSKSRGDVFVILNVASWFDAHSIGKVIDENGTVWDINSQKKKNWVLITNTVSTNNTTPSWLRFENLMERVLKMTLKAVERAALPRQTKIIWRSESRTDCNPIGGSFRAPVRETLQKLHISILNISEATCKYVNQELDDFGPPHLCFPSVVLRHWLMQFQEQFL